MQSLDVSHGFYQQANISSFFQLHIVTKASIYSTVFLKNTQISTSFDAHKATYSKFKQLLY
jgi:hypothetical protein